MEKAICKFHDPKYGIPKDAKIGDRYISLRTENGWVINRIYENSNQWLEIIPSEGYIIWLKCENTFYVFNGITWTKLTINHNDMKNIGELSHKKLDDHVYDKNLHMKNSDVDHSLIKNIGTNSHNDIDKHINNFEDAHFGQNLTSFGNPKFNSIYINECSMANHVVTKNYVDNAILGISWQSSVIEIYDPTIGLPNGKINNRYLCSVSASSWKKDYIYEYYDKKWNEIIPMINHAVYIEGGNIFLITLSYIMELNGLYYVLHIIMKV